MNCDCGGKSLVLETRNTPTGAMARKRRCKVCGQIFWTGEIKLKGEPEVINPHTWQNMAGTKGARAETAVHHHDYKFFSSTSIGPIYQCSCGSVKNEPN